MAYIVWTKEWSSSDDGTILTGSDLQDIQDDITAVFNGNITNGNIAADANIDLTKIDLAGLDAGMNFMIYGSGVTIETGVKGDIRWPFAATITGVYLLADQTGDIEIDIWVDTLANFPPTVADSITGAAVPKIESATYSSDTSLTGWTTSIASGSIMRFNVNSATDITHVTVAITYERV
jgi:hypothetical protein